MKFSAYKSEGFEPERVNAFSRSGVWGVLPQTEEIKYIGILFTNGGKLEPEMDRLDASLTLNKMIENLDLITR